MKSSPVFVGIDVAKANLDVALRPSDQTWQVPDEDAQVEALVDPLTELAPILIVVEATGGLETPLVAALAAAKLPVVVINELETALLMSAQTGTPLSIACQNVMAASGLGPVRTTVSPAEK